MKAEMARVGQGLWWLLAKIFNSASLRTWWSQSLAGETENDQSLSWTLAAPPNNGRRWPALPLQMVTASYGNCHDLYFYIGRRLNNWNFPPEAFSPNLVFAPTIKIQLAFLQVRSSAASALPFELHPVILVTAVICSITYYLSFAAMFVFPRFASLFKVIISSSGFLAVASLTSLVLQLPWWSVFFILLFLGGFFKLLKKLHGIHGNIRRLQP